VINVYSKCSLAEKREMWEKLLEFRGSLGGDVWCVSGDFNSVLHESERRGTPLGSGNPLGGEICDFSRFVHLMGLLDFPLLGRRFTWCQPNGNVMSRLDRFLLSMGWWDLWVEATQWPLSRDVSDHSPIVLKYSSQVWGPKPFRFNNFWLDQSDLVEVMSHSWNRSRPVEWMVVRLAAKLKTPKGDLKEWHSHAFGRMGRRIDAQVEALKLFDLKAEVGPLSPEDAEARFKGFHDLWALLRVRVPNFPTIKD